MKWNKITNDKDSLPVEFGVVLAAHAGDTNPVVASFHFETNPATQEISAYWMRELEGPVDGGHWKGLTPFYHNPTHWMYLPEMPEEDE